MDNIEEYLKKTRKTLVSIDKKDFFNKKLYDSSSYLLKEGGKLLRPSLVFLGALYSGIDPEEVIDMSISIELLHTSSLIHDDLIDKDLYRRGVNATHVKFGNEIALLAGDALISEAIRRASSYGKKVIDIMAVTAMKMAAGESLDFEFQKNREVPKLKDYFNISELKSTSLIETAISLPAIYKNQKEANELKEFGYNFGMAFQIKDDIDDYILARDEKKSSEKNRPNIVNSLTASGIKEEDAISKAKLLNKEYLISGEKCLKGINKKELLEYKNIASV
ncbi:MAG: polyprenyl synthetase family protein [Candidatus Micrarchaeia archaeon]